MRHPWPSDDVGTDLDAAEPASVGATVRARRLDTVTPESVSWLWHDRIPLGKLTLLVGDPGCGKSYASLALTAAITTGTGLPADEGWRRPGAVIIWNAEDGPEDTIRPRADACGADPTRVVLLEDFLIDGHRSAFRPDHVPQIERLVDTSPGCQLFVVDPVVSLVSGKTDIYRDNEVRAALDPLVNLAARKGLAVLGLMHMNKATALKALYRVSGSLGFVGLARSVLLAARDEETGRCAIVAIKHNLAAPSAPIEYAIDGNGFMWKGEAPDLGAERLLAAPATPEQRNEREDAVDFLRNHLADGPVRSRDVREAATEHGLSWRTVERARKTLAITAEQLSTGPKGRNEWWLSLPGQTARPPDPPVVA